MAYDYISGVYYDPNELYHHGIKGQKWGVRRFQPYSTTGARKGGKTGKEIGLAKRAGDSIKKFRQERAAKKAETAKAKAAKAAEDKRKRDEQLMADKERILREGSAGEVLTLKGKITNQELRTAVERINLEQQLSSVAAKQVSDGKKVLESIGGFVKTTADIANDVKRAKSAVDDILGKEEEKQRKKLINEGTAEDVKKYGTKYLKAEDYKTIANRMKNQVEIEKYLQETTNEAAEDSEKMASMKRIRQMIDDALDEREDN